MRNLGDSSTKPKIVALILSFTAVTVILFALDSNYSDADSAEWRNWVEIWPQVAVLLVFGVVASRWREILVFALAAVGVNLIFIVSHFIFEPAIYAELVELYFASAGLFWAVVVICLSIFAFLPLAIGFSLRRLVNSCAGALMPDSR